MFKKNTAVTGFQIGHFIQTADGAAKTTGTPACKRLLDGTPGTLTNAASYDSTAGVWKIDLAAADTNGDMVGLSFTLADCLPISFTLRTTTKLVSELNDLGGTAQTGDAFARLGAPAGASVSADVAAVKAETVAILADTGTDGVKIHTTQGAVTFGQVKILASVGNEGALHIVNSSVSSNGEGMHVEGGYIGTINKATETSGIGQYNRSTGSFGTGVLNHSSGTSSTGQNNVGIAVDVVGDILGNLTGSVSSVASGGLDTATLTSGALNAIADAVLKRDWTAVTGEASRSLLNALRFLRNKWSVSGSTLTVTKEDDSTAAWTAALTTDAAADPITGSDPA